MSAMLKFFSVLMNMMIWTGVIFLTAKILGESLPFSLVSPIALALSLVERRKRTEEKSK